MNISNEKWAEKWGVDSNIIIYALNKEAPQYDAVNTFLHRALSRKTPLFISPQNILEFENVMARAYKIPLGNLIKDIAIFIETFRIRVIYPSPTTIAHYHSLVATYPARNIFDVFLAATFLDNGVSHIFTANVKDFVQIPGLKVYGT